MGTERAHGKRGKEDVKIRKTGNVRKNETLQTT